VRSYRQLLCGAVWLMVACVVHAAPNLQIAPLGYRVEQITPIIGQPRTFDLTARAAIVNSGDPASSVTARLSSSVVAVQVLDGVVSFGTVPRTPLLRPQQSVDTFRLRFTVPELRDLQDVAAFARSLVQGLTWQISCANCTANRPPVADAGAPQSIRVSDRVVLDGSRSSDPDGDALSYRWTLLARPAGSAATLAESQTVMPSFVADKPGAFVAQLVVTDGRIDSAPSSVSITTENSQPIARAGPPISGRVGSRVQLDGSASTDVDGDPLTYEWLLAQRPQGSAAVILNADPASPFADFVLDRAGEYVASLIVRDRESQSAPVTTVVSTVNSQPVADAGPDRSAPVGRAVEIDASASTDVDGDALTYRWSLSTPVGSQSTLTTSAGPATSFAPDRPGTYVVQLIANDAAVDSEPDTVVVSTENSAPVADAGDDLNVAAGDEAVLDGTRSFDVDGDPLSFAWSIVSQPPGEATVIAGADQPSAGFVPQTPGTYVAQLAVNDGRVTGAPDTAVVQANERPQQPPTLPVAPRAELIDVIDSALSVSRIVGAAGAVASNSFVVITAFDSGESVSVRADAAGAFTADITTSRFDAVYVRVVDSAGRSSTSILIAAGQQPTLVIDGPLGALPPGPARVWGRASVPRGSGITVNGAIAGLNGGTDAVFFFQGIAEIDPGENDVEVTAHLPDGRTLVRHVVVHGTAEPAAHLTATPRIGTAPAPVQFEVVSQAGLSYDAVDYDFDGDGVVDWNATAEEVVYQEFPTSGSYLVKAHLMRAGAVVRSLEALVLIHSPQESEAAALATMDRWLGALADGQLDIAAARMTTEGAHRYGALFATLGSRLDAITAEFSEPVATQIGDRFVELAVVRAVEGVQRAFLGYVVLCADGIWRVESI